VNEVEYPQVTGEFETVEELLRGKSLARFGDGELKLMDGQGYFREPKNEKLGAELLEVLQRPAANCLVGIPTMDFNGPKYENWIRHRDRFAKLLAQGPSVESKALSSESDLGPQSSTLNAYYSAFITRPDSAPWINCLEYARLVEQLWKDKRAAVLSERDNSILKVVRLSAKKLKHVECPHREAYAEIDALERALVRAKPEIALLSCGPTATCLANRMASRGIQAVDIGSAGGFLLKLLAAAR